MIPAPTLTPADERRIAAAHTPRVAWPTLLLAIATPVAFWTLIYHGFTHQAPLWLLPAPLAALSFVHYTIVHECIHNNIVSGRARWLHELFGWVGAIGLSQNYPILKRTHVLHHAHTNTAQDPDIFVKGTFRQLLMKWLMIALFSLAPVWLVQRLRGELRAYVGALTPSERWLTYAISTLYVAAMVAAIATGHLLEWTLLWFVPTRLGVLILNIFFQWLPHFPFDRTERYYDTRVSLWPAAGFLLLQQNLHLVHHLWPAVPFYKYPSLYRALRPLLLAKGARIQGLMVGTFAQDLSAQEQAKVELETAASIA